MDEMSEAMRAVAGELHSLLGDLGELEVGEVKCTTNGFTGGIDVRIEAMNTNLMEELVIVYTFRHGRLTWLTTDSKQDA